MSSVPCDFYRNPCEFLHGDIGDDGDIANIAIIASANLETNDLQNVSYYLYISWILISHCHTRTVSKAKQHLCELYGMVTFRMVAKWSRETLFSLSLNTEH